MAATNTIPITMTWSAVNNTSTISTRANRAWGKEMRARERYVYHLFRDSDPRASAGGYDQATDIVVIARSSTRARELAATKCGDEGPGPWLHGRRSGRPHAKVRRLGIAPLSTQKMPARERVVVVVKSAADVGRFLEARL